MGGGCLLCGVEAVTLPALRVAALKASEGLWRVLTAPTSALGGLMSPEPLTGACCPACTDALERVGTVGPTALKRSLEAHLRATGRGDLADQLRLGEVEGMLGWGGLVFDARRRGEPVPSPNCEPWAHLDLRGVTA